MTMTAASGNGSTGTGVNDVPDRDFRPVESQVDPLMCCQQDGNLPPDIAYPADG